MKRKYRIEQFGFKLNDPIKVKVSQPAKVATVKIKDVQPPVRFDQWPDVMRYHARLRDMEFMSRVHGEVVETWQRVRIAAWDRVIKPMFSVGE